MINRHHQHEEELVEAIRGMKGFYRVQVLDKDRNVKQDTDWFPNLITDRGLDYFCSLTNELNSRPGQCLYRCTVGTGSAAPVPGDLHLAGTILGTVVVPSGTSGVWVSTPEYYVKWDCTYEFPLGSVVGNVAEIGVGPSNFVTSAPYDDLTSRALVVDGGGSPVAITVLADEILRVFYELRCYCDMAADSSYNIDISGVSYAIVQRPAELGMDGLRMNNPCFVSNTGGNYTDTAALYSTQTLGAKTARPASTGGSVNFNGTGLGTYALGQHYRDLILGVGTTQGNFAGGIGSCVFGNFNGKWQMSFTPKIPKDNLKILTLNFRQTFVRA